MVAHEPQRIRSLCLCAMLHGFTHVYHVALIPLYLLISTDLELHSAASAPMLVTIMGVAYFLPAYAVGALSDRYSRKHLLAFGLLLNGVGFTVLGMSRTYNGALAGAVLSGLGGSFFHPAATSLIARLFPTGTGRALGWIGVGASLGFFIAPLYSGWRATSTGSWRAPVIELGILGMIAALAFLRFAAPDPARSGPNLIQRGHEPMFTRASMWFWFLLAAAAFSCRDFGGTGVASLTSLYLQHGHGLSAKTTGLALSTIFLASVISNPFFGGLSDRHRFRWIAFVLLMASALVILLPYLGPEWVTPVLALYGAFIMASYPMTESLLMTSVPDQTRGRVFGMFITVGGLTGNLSHGIVGGWVDVLGPDKSSPAAFQPLFLQLAILIAITLLGLPCLRLLHRLGTRPIPEPCPGTATPPLEHSR